MSSETAWSPSPAAPCWVQRAQSAPLLLSLGMLMPGDVSLGADAERGHARPRRQLCVS